MALPYAQVINHDFVRLDDNVYITENVHVQKGLSLDNVKYAFTDFSAANWHPLTWLSHMLDCQLFGLNAGMHHIVNVFFHLLTTILCFFVFYRMTGELWPCFMVALLFAIHPLHVESVAWVSERKDVLSAFFWFLTLLLYFEYVKREKNLVLYFLMIFTYALGLMSKPMLVTLPFAMLLLDVWPLERISLLNSSGRLTQIISNITILAKEKIPLFVLMFASCVITIKAQGSAGAIDTLENIPLGMRVLNSINAYVEYLYKTIWPINLACLYPYDKNVAIWRFILSALILSLITWAVIRKARAHPYLLTGWFWYLGTLVPVIGLVQVGMQSLADRYTYIPHVGIWMIICWGLSGWIHNSETKRRFVTGIFLLVVCFFEMTTYYQVKVWKNSETLLSHAIKVTKNNYVAHNNLGSVYFKKGDISKAAHHYKEALRISPDYMAYNNVGITLALEGRIEEAIDFFLKSIQLKNTFKNSHFNLGVAYEMKGMGQDAILSYQKALDIDPQYTDAQRSIKKAQKK